MKPFRTKQRSASSLDALLKKTAAGTEKANVIDKALTTTTDRLMKANVEFEKSYTITTSDESEMQKYTILQPNIDSELQAARELKKQGVTPRERRTKVEPIPPAFFTCRKVFKNNMLVQNN